MEIEFDCGVKVPNVGAPAMAARAHIGKCDDAACQADVTAYAKAHAGTFVDF